MGKRRYLRELRKEDKKEEKKKENNIILLAPVVRGIVRVNETMQGGYVLDEQERMTDWASEDIVVKYDEDAEAFAGVGISRISSVRARSIRGSVASMICVPVSSASGMSKMASERSSNGNRSRAATGCRWS